MLTPDQIERLRLEAEAADKAYRKAVAAFEQLGPESERYAEMREAVREARRHRASAQQLLEDALAGKLPKDDPAFASTDGPTAFGYETPPRDQDQATNAFDPEREPRSTDAFQFEKASRMASQTAREIFDKRSTFWKDVRSILFPDRTPDPDRSIKWALYASGLVLFLFPLGP